MSRSLRLLLLSLIVLLVHPGAAQAEPEGTDEDEEDLPLIVPGPPKTISPLECCCPNGATKCERDSRGEWWQTRVVPNEEARSFTLAGVAILGTGVFIAVTHALASSNSNRFIELIPVAGPIAAAWDGKQSPFASSALVFSSWTQAVGLLMVSIAASMPSTRLEKQRVTFSGGPGQVGAGLSVSY
jgi:hypothetical protein